MLLVSCGSVSTNASDFSKSVPPPWLNNFSVEESRPFRMVSTSITLSERSSLEATSSSACCFCINVKQACGSSNFSIHDDRCCLTPWNSRDICNRMSTFQNCKFCLHHAVDKKFDPLNLSHIEIVKNELHNFLTTGKCLDISTDDVTPMEVSPSLLTLLESASKFNASVSLT